MKKQQLWCVFVGVVVGLMMCVWLVKGLMILLEAWPFGFVFVVKVEMVEASIVQYYYCIWVSWDSVPQTVAQRVRNLHHLKHIYLKCKGMLHSPQQLVTAAGDGLA